MLTEAEWRVSDNLHAMFDVLRGNPCASERKLRLFVCACAECAIAHVPNRPQYQRILTTAERWAEGVAQPDEVKRSWDEGIALELTHTGPNSSAAMTNTVPAEGHRAAVVTDTLQADAHRAAWGTAHELERYEQESHRQFDPKRFADLLRCVFGIPYRGLNVGFKLVKLDPAWRTSDVVALARGIYDDRAFDRMPILADALQDAGCTNDDILNHCRDTATPHARGCWVVDLVLEKV